MSLAEIQATPAAVAARLCYGCCCSVLCVAQLLENPVLSLWRSSGPAMQFGSPMLIAVCTQKSETHYGSSHAVHVQHGLAPGAVQQHQQGS